MRLLFFAVLRDIAGTSERDVVVPEGATPYDVWQSLRESYPTLTDYTQPPLVAINEAYAPPGTVLRDGDELAFIPPVAGG